MGGNRSLGPPWQRTCGDSDGACQSEAVPSYTGGCLSLEKHSTLICRLFLRPVREIIPIVTALFLVGIAGMRLNPRLYSRIPTTVAGILDIGPDAKYRKLRAMYLTVVELPKSVWFQPLIGIGFGQYASRAALFATREYGKIALPFPRYAGTYTERIILPLLRVANSSTHFPTSSWMATYGEMGLVGLLVAVLVIVKGVLRFRRYRSVRFLRMNLCMVISLLYLALIGFQAVYWEYTQAIFPAVLTIKLCYDYLSKERSDLRNRAQRCDVCSPEPPSAAPRDQQALSSAAP